MGKRKDLKERKAAYRVGSVRTLEQFVCSKYTLESTNDFSIWLDKMTGLRNSILRKTSFRMPGQEPDGHPPISPSFLLTILLANIPTSYLGWAVPLLPSTTWDEVVTRLREWWSAARTLSLMDNLPGELVREILLWALPDLDLRTRDPELPDGRYNPYQKTTINSALKRQDDYMKYKLVCKRWNVVLGRADHLAVKTIVKAIDLTRLVREHPELGIAERTKVMTLCVRDESKGNRRIRARGRPAEELLKEFPNLLELHVGGPWLYEVDDPARNRWTESATQPWRIDRIVKGASTLKRLRRISFLTDDIYLHEEKDGTLPYEGLIGALPEWPHLTHLHLCPLSYRLPVPFPPFPAVNFHLQHLSITIHNFPSIAILRGLRHAGALDSLSTLDITLIDLYDLELEVHLLLKEELVHLPPSVRTLTVKENVRSPSSIVNALLYFADNVTKISLGKDILDVNFAGGLPRLNRLEMECVVEDFSWSTFFRSLLRRAALEDAERLQVDVIYAGDASVDHQPAKLRSIWRNVDSEVDAKLPSVATIRFWVADRSWSPMVVAG